MPTTQNFLSGTHGNGFNFCPGRINVDDADRWITASGHKKGDGVPTAASINLSLIKCSRMFWHLYSVSGYTVTSDGSGFDNYPSYNGAQSAEGVYIIADDATVVGGISSEAGSEIEPYERVCKSFVQGGETGLRDNSSIVCHGYGVLNVRALYDGGILMGYGFFQAVAYARASFHLQFSCESLIVLSSMIFSERPDASRTDYDYAYVEIDGFHFTCEAVAVGDTGSIFADATALTASAASAGQGITAESAVDFSGLTFNFWTFS